MKTCLVLCALATFVLAGCSQAPPDTREADIKALKDLEIRWVADYAAKDLDRVSSNYAEDAVLMSSGMPASAGKDAIRKTLKEMLADPAFSLKFQTAKVEVSKGSDTGFTQGTYMLTMTEPNSKKVINDHGSYVTTYRKQADGAWKAVADISSSEVPPPAPMPDKGKK